MHVCEEHLLDLKNSGLSTESIESSKLYCADRQAVSDLLGFDAGCGGLVFPYFDDHGKVVLSRIKPDVAFIGPSGPAKYLSPKKSTNHLYFPPSIDYLKLSSKRIPLIITEGEKKALKAVDAGLCCIALAGVNNWKSKDSVIPDFDRIYWKGRKVFICFDSDVAMNTQVRKAETDLAKELMRRGAVVSGLRIPPKNDGGKQGLDDYLISHSVESFWGLQSISLSEATETPLLTLGEFMAKTYPPMQHLIGDGVISNASLSSIVGRAKLGKTWFSMQLGLCVAGLSSCFVMDQLPVNQTGKVLYINAEVAEPILHKRLGLQLAEAESLGMNIEAPKSNFVPLTVRGDLRLDRIDGQKRLAKIIGKIKPVLVILDPIGPLHYWDENKQQDMGKLLNYLLSLISYFNCAIIMVHHMGKSNENREEIHFGRGSSVLGDRVDSNLNLIGYGESAGAAQIKLSFTLRNGPPIDPVIVSRREKEFLYHAMAQMDDVVLWLEDYIRAEGSADRSLCWEAYKISGRFGEKTFQRGLKQLEDEFKVIRERTGVPPRIVLHWAGSKQKEDNS